MLRLKELREQQRLSQTDLAENLNVSQATISAYEIGTRSPDLKMLIAFANFFGVSLDYLAGLSDIRQPLRSIEPTTDELVYLQQYRQLSDIDREKVKSYMDGLHSRT